MRRRVPGLLCCELRWLVPQHFVSLAVGDAAHSDSSVAGFARSGPGVPFTAGLLLPDAEHRLLPDAEHRDALARLGLRAQGQGEDVDVAVMAE